MIKLLRSALVSSSPPFTLAAKCRPYSCAEYSRGKETISADTLYSERYNDFGRHCTGDNYLSALSALRLQETTYFKGPAEPVSAGERWQRMGRREGDTF